MNTALDAGSARVRKGGPVRCAHLPKFSLEEIQHARVLWLGDKSGVYTCAVTKPDWHCSDRAAVVTVVGTQTMPGTTRETWINQGQHACMQNLLAMQSLLFRSCARTLQVPCTQQVHATSAACEPACTHATSAGLRACLYAQAFPVLISSDPVQARGKRLAASILCLGACS